MAGLDKLDRRNWVSTSSTGETPLIELVEIKAPSNSLPGLDKLDRRDSR